ncbi:MAG: glycosyltransferase [Bacteroidales bacterium]|nr:glycosyltransferase [Bacteroidales bacterium]
MTDPLKVVLIGSAHPLRGGLANFNERLIREYRKRGDHAFIYTFSLQYPSLLFPGKTQLSSEPAPANLPVYIKVNSINPWNWVSVGLELKRQNPDLVLVKYWMPFMAPCFSIICRIIKKNRHSRIISIIDNIIPHEKKPFDRFLSGFWVRSVDGFIAMSHAVMNDLETFDKSKPKIFCPHPLYDNFGDPVPKEVAQKRLGLDPGFKYILFFGFIRDYKGLDLLLNAFADERLSNTNIRLLIAGEFYCDPKPYIEIIARHNLEEKVIMSNDFIPDSKVLNYFCAADLVVQPYKTATQSGVTQIAYHFNKPMIITNVGGLAEFVPDGKVGYVVEPDSTAIASAIIRFYSENRETAFSYEASIEKQKYSWSRMVQAIAEAAGFEDLKI